MTVSAQTPINRSAGNGVTTVFPYTFKIIADADIEVSVDDVVKTLNVDYTVSGAGADAGGNVTMTTAPASMTTVVRRRNMALTRTTDYQDQGLLPAATLDNDIDAPVMMIQQLDERLSRTFSLPVSSSADATMPVPAAGYVIGWDALGESLTNLPASVGTSLIDLAASSGASLVGYTQGGPGAVATTVQSKQSKTIHVTDFMTDAQRADILLTVPLLDHTAAIQAAITASFEGGKVLFPMGTYRITSTLTFSYICQTIEGVGYAGMYGRPKLLWAGAAGGTMFKVADQIHYATVRNMQFDGAKSANICLHIEVIAGHQTNNPTLENITFIGYNARGLVLGVDDDVTPSNGQLSNVSTSNLQWRGGGAVDAIGFFMNAQNCEHCVGSSWYFEPWEDNGYFRHRHHIRVKRGGLTLTGLLTTMSTDFAVSTEDTITVYDWHAEDRYVFSQVGADNKAPSTISNLVQRYDATYASTDYAMVIAGAIQPVMLMGATLQGSIHVSATTEFSLVALGLVFPWGGSVVYDGTSASNGFVHVMQTGDFQLRGSSPAMKLRRQNGGLISEFSQRTVLGYLALPTGATPSVSGGTVFGTNNGGATTITAFTGLDTGQLITLIGNDGGLTTVSNTASIKLAGGANFVVGLQDTITFVGGVSGEALEVSRSNN